MHRNGSGTGLRNTVAKVGRSGGRMQLAAGQPGCLALRPVAAADDQHDGRAANTTHAGGAVASVGPLASPHFLQQIRPMPIQPIEQDLVEHEKPVTAALAHRPDRQRIVWLVDPVAHG
jgi:hypothetical protein